MIPVMNPVCFLGNSLERLREFPEDARQDAGYQLDKVQRGEQPDDFKAMPAIVARDKWTQTKAAGRRGITQPRMNDLLRGRVSHFSLDALVKIATALGRRVHMELKVT
jgi:DNA-binding Xre family transcriptional regulator